MTVVRARFTLVSVVLVLVALAAACGSGAVSPPTEAAGQAAPDADPFEGVVVPAEYAARPVRDMMVGREDSLVVELYQLNPRTREVGDRFNIWAYVTVNQKFWKVDIERLLSGAIDEFGSNNRPASMSQSASAAESASGIGSWIPVGFDATCVRVGIGSYTIQATVELKDADGEFVGVNDVTVDGTVDCVAKSDVAGGPYSTLAERTSGALGFSEDSLNWVAFEQGGVVLRVNQIDPVRLDVGDSVEIYADFDARNSIDVRDLELRDARLDFTGGGPITIDSPPDRQSDLVTVSSTQYPDTGAVGWGFRSGTLSCLSEGEGVYSVTLTGFLQKGGTTTQIVSGEVDCIEPPSMAVPDAKRDATADVYNLGGEGSEDIAYDHAQFRIEQPHDGCSSTHVHADFTVLAFREWASGGLSGPRTNGDLPRVDPDLSGCGFGSPDSLSHRRVRVPGQIFLDFCTRVEQAGTSKPMVTRCEQQRIFLTSE